MLPCIHSSAQSHEQAIALARTKLGLQVFAVEWAEGREMTVEHALAFATQVSITEKVPPLRHSSALQPSSPTPVRLTRREQEVLRWLARGLTNPQIAEQLVVSVPTVTTHVASIFNKLDVTSRSAATRYAIEHNLT